MGVKYEMRSFKRVDLLNLKEWARKVIDERAYRCIRCGTCRTILHTDIRSIDFGRSCPPGEYFKVDGFYALGKEFAAQGVVEGVIPASDQLLTLAYADPLCGFCQYNCRYINAVLEKDGDHIYLEALPAPYETQEALRVLLVEEGIGPHPVHKQWAGSIEKNHNPYFEPHERRFDWLSLAGVPVQPLSEVDIIYFAGCTASYRQREIAISTIRILHKLCRRTGLKLGVLGGEEWCCGSPLFRTGQYRAGYKTLTHVVNAINSSSAKTVVTSCAGCYRVLAADVQRLGLELAPTVKHTVELLVDCLGDLDFQREVKMKVTYHDPCHIGRHLYPSPGPLYDAPREILRKIPGLELVEMQRIKDYSWCCAAGGGVKSAYPDLALWAAGERVREAMAVNAEAIVSACPFCHLNLRDSVRIQALTLGVYDITEIVAKALGVM